MDFCFYPNHELGCPNVNHCPHLGGAGLGTLVYEANTNGQMHDLLYAQLDAARDSVNKLVQENEELKQQIEQLKLQLNLERQNKFATNQQLQEEDTEEDGAAVTPEASQHAQPRKRGAPVGHPGWFRPTPTEYDLLVEVAAPTCCPHCGGPVSVYDSQGPSDHLQEDIVGGQYHVTLFRHPCARCRSCRQWVQQAGEGEILGSKIGPFARSYAIYLHNDIGISSRKVPRAIEELFGFRFTPAALLGFERMLSDLAEQAVEDIQKKVASTQGAAHADETYWILDGERSYFWIHGTEKHIHFQFDTSRAGEVSRNILGEYFTGTLVTDCYAGYDAQQAKAKQKCLAHLKRSARDWQKLTSPNSLDYAFFRDIQTWVKRGCRFVRDRAQLTVQQRAKQEAWLRAELGRLQSCPLTHAKAVTLQERIKKHHDCWLVFLDDERVPPTNNLAERSLRPLVIMRKITFGHRSVAGAQCLARIMTVKETAKRHGRKAIDVFYRMYTRPPDEVLRYIYGGA